jgi:hypothetical protein
MLLADASLAEHREFTSRLIVQVQAGVSQQNPVVFDDCCVRDCCACVQNVPFPEYRALLVGYVL